MSDVPEIPPEPQKPVKMKNGKPVRMRYSYPEFPPKEGVPTGKQLVQLLENAGVHMTDEERKHVLSIVDDEEMKVFLNAHIGALEPREAKSELARFIMRLDIPSVMMLAHMDNLRSCDMAIDFAKELLKVENITIHDKSEVTRTFLMAIHERGMVVRGISSLVSQLFERPALKPKKVVQKTAPAEVIPRQKNKPPDTSTPQPHLDSRIKNVVAQTGLSAYNKS